MSALVLEDVVLMDWSSSSCVMKGMFMLIEEGLGVAGDVVLLLGLLVRIAGFETVGGERRSV